MTTQKYQTGLTSTKSKSKRVHPWLTTILGSAALGGITAFATTLWLPRGPVTAVHVWVVLLSSLLIGLIGGATLRTRWAMILLPLAYIAVVELTRLNAVGPTVDALRLDNPYGLLALIVGRGFHGLVAFLPLLLGIELALTWAEVAEKAITPLRAILHHPLLPLLTLLVAALVVLNAIPARTPAIVDANGQPIPGSIAEMTAVELGGQEQTILIRGHSADLPVLLYLSGGPGQSDLPYSRVLLEDITQDFIVVSWDQRGTGKSYASLEPTADLTLEQAVADTIALTNYLRDRFGAEKIYLMGESWGTTLGVLAVQQQPELYHAWIGSGQMISQRETDRQLYHDILALAERTGNSALREQMLAFGEPPYADVPYPNAIVMSHYEELETPYTPPSDYVERGTAANLGPYAILGSEYNFVEKVNVLRGLIDMFGIMYPQIQGIDFRQDVPRLEVPVYILDGTAELPARRELALAWYEALEAPSKQLYTFDNAGHSVAFEQFTALRQILTETILPETQP